jgi:hypothetical protein
MGATSGSIVEYSSIPPSLRRVACPGCLVREPAHGDQLFEKVGILLIEHAGHRPFISEEVPSIRPLGLIHDPSLGEKSSRTGPSPLVAMASDGKRLTLAGSACWSRRGVDLREFIPGYT